MHGSSTACPAAVQLDDWECSLMKHDTDQASNRQCDPANTGGLTAYTRSCSHNSSSCIAQQLQRGKQLTGHWTAPASSGEIDKNLVADSEDGVQMTSPAWHLHMVWLIE